MGEETVAFDIQPLTVDVPSMLAPRDEVASLINEYALGHAVREVALFRVWRLWRDKSYLQIYSDDPGVSMTTPIFSSFNDLLALLTKRIDVSRSKVYSRLKTYSLLLHLRYVESEMVHMMAVKPGLYERALNAIFIWDQEGRSVTGMKTDAFGDDPYADETIENVRAFLVQLDNADSIGDALSMLMHEVLGKPMVRIRFDSQMNALNVVYSTDSLDNNTGETIVGDVGEITFVSDDELPPWVVEELSKKYPARQ